MFVPVFKTFSGLWVSLLAVRIVALVPRNADELSAVDELQARSSIFGRDVCATSLGPNRYGVSCAASDNSTGANTFCCLDSQNIYPQCQAYVSYGWCCRGSGQSCYVDMRSQCDKPGAVRCTNLANGTSQACCPSYTTCENGNVLSETFVRCNAPQILLRSLDAATASVAAPTTTPTSTSTATRVSSALTAASLSTMSTMPASTTSAAATNNNGSDSSGKKYTKAEFIGGIVGAIVGITLLIVGFLWYRKKRPARKDTHPREIYNPDQYGVTKFDVEPAVQSSYELSDSRA